MIVSSLKAWSQCTYVYAGGDVHEGDRYNSFGKEGTGHLSVETRVLEHARSKLHYSC